MLTMSTGIHRANMRQIGLFALNDTAVNLYFLMMGYMSYYLAGVLGLAVALVSFLLAALNIFDGITDPIIGYIIDKTSGRFGKFRPFMVSGNVILALNLGFLYCIRHAPSALILPLLIVCLIIYDIGFTLQANVTRSAQAVLTNDPKQRPLFAAFSTVFSVLLYVGVAVMVSEFLIPRHGDFSAEMFGDFFILVAFASAVCTILAVIGIRAKDRPAYYGAPPEAAQKVKLRDCIGILKHNRNVRMLIISASTDRLFSHIAMNAVVLVMIFGIIGGNYELYGRMSMLVFAPSMLVALSVIWYARRHGQRAALLLSTKGAMLANTLIFLAFVFGDPTTLSFSAWSSFTILFFVGLAFRGGFMTIGGRIIIPMIADCSDDEVFRSGKYVPGMISGLFTFADKIFGSLNMLMVGALVILAGYGDMFPSVTTAYSSPIFIIAMICYCGLPMLGWIINLIALRYYDLTPARIEQVRKTAAERKKTTEA